MMPNITKYTLNSIGFYFLFPMYFATACLFVFFNVPVSFYWGIFALLAIITIPTLIMNKIFPLDLNLQNSYDVVQKKQKFRFIILLFSATVIFAGFLDIYINGLKLLNPSTYAKLNGNGRYVRHISMLCWILIPVAFIFLRTWKVRAFFVAYAFLFPILIIDRNRLFLSFYSFIVCFLLSFRSLESSKKKGIVVLSISCMMVFSLVLFAAIGKFRVGKPFAVRSSGTLLIKNQYPLTKAFTHLPASTSQAVMYITSPIFNFATIAAADFRNPQFLLNQLAPFSKEHSSFYPYAPVLISGFNIGTEFYPFLLYGGLSLVLCSFVLMLLTVVLFSFLFKKSPNIFTYIIFIKLSYGALFLGFGPQFFILYNLMVILLMLSLWGGAVSVDKLSKKYWIPKRKIELTNAF